MRAPAVLLLLLLLTACARGPALVPEPRYVVGAGYQLGGHWSYPREDYALVEQGLAVVLPAGPARRTANGEVTDPTGMLAAHRTLQLPAIVLVTNLENGRALRLRVHDRGPVERGRFLGVSRRAGELLDARPGVPFQARLEVLGEESRAAAEGLEGDRVRVGFTAAPVGTVGRESLAPPDGARGVAGAAPVRAAAVLEEARRAPAPERLPEDVAQGAPRPGLLMLDGGTFFTFALARQAAARLGGVAEAVGPRSRQQEFRVRAGPFGSVAQADAALARAVAAGLAGARIVVE